MVAGPKNMQEALLLIALLLSPVLFYYISIRVLLGVIIMLLGSCYLFLVYRKNLPEAAPAAYAETRELFKITYTWYADYLITSVTVTRLDTGDSETIELQPAQWTRNPVGFVFELKKRLRGDYDKAEQLKNVFDFSPNINTRQDEKKPIKSLKTFYKERQRTNYEGKGAAALR